MRFFAEVQGINSQFKVVSTTFTPTTEDEPCDPEVYFDCEDTNCISRSLLCNKNRNCKFGWDEEANCEADDEQEAVLDMSSPHVVIILLVLLIILVLVLGKKVAFKIRPNNFLTFSRLVCARGWCGTSAA